MHEQKSIKKNMLMSILLEVSNFLFPILTFSYVSRVITPSGIGKIAFVQSILSYFSYIAILGIPAYGMRECIKVRDNKEKMSHLVQELLIISLCATSISYILLIGAVSFIPKLNESRNIFIILSVSILLNSIGMEWLYQAIEEYTYITVRSLIVKTCTVILTFLLIKSKNDYLWYAFLQLLTSSANSVFNIIYVRKHITLQKKGKYHFKNHLKPIFTLFFASVSIAIYSSFDVSMLGFISTEMETGLYNATLKIRTILNTVTVSLTSVLVPRIGYYIESKREQDVIGLLLKSLRISMLISVPLALYVFIYAKDILLFICGQSYLSAATTLRISMICIISLVFTNLFGNMLLIPLGRDDRYSQSVFVSLWINLVMNAIFIPRLGALGAALGTLISEVWNAYWMSGGVKEGRNYLLKQFNFMEYLVPMIFAFSIGWIVSGWVSMYNVFWRLSFTTLSSFGAYYLLLWIRKEALITDMIQSLINKLFYNNKAQ